MSLIHDPVQQQLIEQYLKVRRFTDRLVEPLSPEDCMIQSMDDASPVRWHLAHTTWFFETFVLRTDPTYSLYHDQYNYLFNSYYNAVGKQLPRPERGLISRPGLDDIRKYRNYVDREVLLRLNSIELTPNMRQTFLVGLNHEQQHQELILTDIKHAFSCNPLLPAYRDAPFDDVGTVHQAPVKVTGGIFDIGFNGDGFCFDNEKPAHQVFVPSFSMDSNLITCGQFIEFIEDGGYQNPDHWLSLGWSKTIESGWDAPLYWVKKNGQWLQFTLAGLVPVNPQWPVCHVSYFEADAFARWSGKRLPTEFEWEIASRQVPRQCQPGADEPLADTLLSSNLAIHPTRSPAGLSGSVWQWTASSYQAYPGYTPPEGAIGEYNGKFMCNQYVLRGGSVATPSLHTRQTYRNFFPAQTRWQFAGIRLAD